MSIISVDFSFCLLQRYKTSTYFLDGEVPLDFDFVVLHDCLRNLRSDLGGGGSKPYHLRLYIYIYIIVLYSFICYLIFPLCQKIGSITVVNKIVELNVALYAFVIIDDDGLRIIEHHPIDVISFASPGREVQFN